MSTENKSLDNDKCMLIKMSEYNELINKIDNLKKSTKPDILKINLVFKIRGNNSGYSDGLYTLSNYTVEGDINLSNRISSQIWNILKNLENKLIKLNKLKIVEDIENYGCIQIKLNNRWYMRKLDEFLNIMRKYKNEKINNNN